MSIITFNASWQPAGTPTDAATATIGIFDNTTETQVVTAGTEMEHSGTGAYTYGYSATASHTYTATMIVTGANGAQGESVQVVYVPVTVPIPANNDDGSSNYIAGQYAFQRGVWTQVKIAALGAIANALAMGEGPSYSISGRAGSESLSLNEFLSNMRETAAKATEMEISLTEQLQFNRPFDIRQCIGVRGRWGI